jgi:hypothetical protein
LIVIALLGAIEPGRAAEGVDGFQQLAGGEMYGNGVGHGSKGGIVIIVRGRDAGFQVSGKPELLFYYFEVDYQGIGVAWAFCEVDFVVRVLEKDGGDFTPFVTRKSDGYARCFHGWISFGFMVDIAWRREICQRW